MLTHEEEIKLRSFKLEHGLMVYLRIMGAFVFGVISFYDFKNFHLLQGMLLAFCVASASADLFSAFKIWKAKKALDEADFVAALIKSENSLKAMGFISMSMMVIIAVVFLKFIPFQFLWVAIIAQFSAQAFELFSRTGNLKY